ncbi:MAG: hypothetical protein F4Z29_01115 [Gemmatimonadetes bacterium]|nr:hypothetical protein [Gemmatimonadota bacterium]
MAAYRVSSSVGRIEDEEGMKVDPSTGPGYRGAAGEIRRDRARPGGTGRALADAGGRSALA